MMVPEEEDRVEKFIGGTDRSFESSTFIALLDFTPFTLDISHTIELVDERVTETNTVLRGCTLGLLGHPFNIVLMPVELDSFDVIIGMDWLANHHASLVALDLGSTRPNGEALRKCILSGPYKPTTVLVQAVEATDNSPVVPEHTTVETPSNMSPENKAHFLAEKEAIHLILTGMGDDSYSTVDACQTAQEMWEAIERLQQDESLNIQDVKINLFWEFGKFTSHDGESMESYYTRFYKLMNDVTIRQIQVVIYSQSINYNRCFNASL
nr:reverse transcriptase domain-containing protein [Tanacetum cinerariifolium]